MPNRVISFDVGIVNLGLWIGTTDESAEQFVTLHWELVDIKACNTNTIAETGYRLMDVLQQRLSLFDIASDPYIVIELQPESNIKMKALSHILQAWFYCQGVHESRIRFVSPRNKLTVYTKPLKSVSESAIIKGSYLYRKNISVEHTKAMLEENNEPQWRTVLDGHVKKDDLADSYLQGCHTLKRLHAVDVRVAKRKARVAAAAAKT